MMQDVIEEPAKPLVGQSLPTNVQEAGEGVNLLSAEELEAAITGKHLTPDQETVNASIEALRPSDTLLEDAELQRLVRGLVESYNARQLAAYLVRAVGPQTNPTTRRGDSAMESSWRPNTTSLKQRPNVISIKKEAGNSKSGLVQQILRLAWGVMAKSETVGELELDFGDAGWKMVMLFKSYSKEGVLNHQSYLGSQLLARKTMISPFWPSNIARVTGRREDAEEAARRIKSRLAEIQSITVDLKPFKNSLIHAPWKTTPHKPMRETDLNVVAKLTSTVIQQAPGCLSIYGQDAVSRSDAVRLALSLLDLPDYKTTQKLDEASSGLEQVAQDLVRAVRQDAEMIEFTATGVHQRLREAVLYRLARPLSRASKASRESQPLFTDQASWQSLSRWQKGQYDQASEVPYPLLARSHWSRSSRQLTATYCNLLQTREDGQGFPHVLKHRLIPHHQAPGLAQLLTCFNVHTKKKTSLTVRMMPIEPGITLQSNLPRILIPMSFNPGSSTPVSRLPESRVSVDETVMPLPAFVVDTIFTSSVRLTWRALGEHPRYLAFIKDIQDSVTRGSGTLSGQPTLAIPRQLLSTKQSFAHGLTDGKAFTDVKYFLEQFEQNQRMWFVPKPSSQLDPSLTPEARELLTAWPKDAVLEVLMVEAGQFGGRRTEVNLIQAPPLSDKHKSLDELQVTSAEPVDREGALLGFIEGAFLVPRLMTMASNGTLYRIEEKKRLLRTEEGGQVKEGAGELSQAEERREELSQAE